MNIGLDLHGVIDLYPKYFASYSKKMREKGDTVHIISGMEADLVKAKVDELGISYDKIFSVVDYNKSIGTNMWQVERPSGRKTWYCGEEAWNRSKGDYITREKIELHFDDSYIYAPYCPNYCTYVIVPKVGFEEFMWQLAI